jgi:hypothetical protein
LRADVHGCPAVILAAAAQLCQGHQQSTAPSLMQAAAAGFCVRVHHSASVGVAVLVCAGGA